MEPKEPKIDLDQQVEMTSKFERLMNDPEEQRRFWKAFSDKYPDAARKFEEIARERAEVSKLQADELGKNKTN